MTSLISPSELTEFLRLPADVRQDVELWSGWLAAITPPIQRALAAIASNAGVSIQTARRRYDAYRTLGWRGLINRAKVPEERGLKPETIAYWKKLCLENGRKCRPAYRELVRRFHAGAPLDGLEPGLDRTVLPRGLGYDNLMRYAPTKLEMVAARIGRSAAAPYMPKLFTTRVGLHVGQFDIYDDMWHDFKVVRLGQRRPMRLLQLHAHDLLSGCQFARGLKERAEDPETGKSLNLTSDEMLFLLAHVMTEYGYYPEGSVQMAEHGTAAISEEVEKLLFDLSGGRITVDRSGMEGASAFAGQYPGRGKGNFRFKAALESLGNLIHNETANLLQFPGQTGSNSRINAPEQMAGREKVTDQLSLAMLALPSQVAIQLRLPYLEVSQAEWLVHEVMERINQRTDHELEGWVEAGFTTIDFQVPGVGIIPASKFLALSPERQAAIQAAASPLPRRLSPREVFDAGRGVLVRFRPEQTAALLKDSQGREVSVGKDHLITFEDCAVSPSPLRYLAHHFAPGDKFLAVVNPWSPGHLYLFDGRGSWIGVVDAWQPVSRTDIDALHAQMGRAAKVQSELLRPLAQHGAELTRKRLEDAQHNSRVLSDEQAKQDQAESAARAAIMENTL
jgi:hypothetical protein